MKALKNLLCSLSFFPVSYISFLYCLRIWQIPPGKPTASDSLSTTSLSHGGLVAFWATLNSTFPLHIWEIVRISSGFSGYKQLFSSFLSLLPWSGPRIGKFPDDRTILECLLTNLHSFHLFQNSGLQRTHQFSMVSKQMGFYILSSLLSQSWGSISLLQLTASYPLI